MAHGYKATEIAWSADVESSAERLTLLALAKWANDDLTCFPSVPTLAAETKLNAKTIRESLKRLDDAGFIRINRQAGRNSVYVITPTKIGSTKNGSTGIGTTTEIGSTPLPKLEGEPLPKTVPEQINEQINEKINLSVDDSSFSLQPEQPQTADRTTATKNARTESKGLSDKETAAAKPAPKRKAITHLFELEGLPDEWRKLCEQIRPDLDPQRVFVEFRFYWTQGKGQGTRRSDKGWTSTWMNWIKRQKEQRVAQTNGKAPLPPHKDPAFHFGKEYYDKSVNPDGTTNWGV